MKAISTFGISLLVLFTTKIFGQTKNYYHSNTFERTYTKCQKPPTFGEDSLALQTYLEDKLQTQVFKTEGQIKINVLIDTTGKPMCEWIENNSNFNVHRHKLNLVIDSMPNWNYGIQNGFKVNCAKVIEPDL